MEGRGLEGIAEKEKAQGLPELLVVGWLVG